MAERKLSAVTKDEKEDRDSALVRFFHAYAIGR
jgi:hypothetical protein